MNQLFKKKLIKKTEYNNEAQENGRQKNLHEMHYSVSGTPLAVQVATTELRARSRTHFLWQLHAAYAVKRILKHFFKPNSSGQNVTFSSSIGKGELNL